MDKLCEIPYEHLPTTNQLPLKMILTTKPMIDVHNSSKSNESVLPDTESCGTLDCHTPSTMGSITDTNLRCICPRKRKEYDDVSEQDVKFSKSSPVENPVSMFMKKWTESPLTPENLIKETLKEQKSAQNDTFPQRCRHESAKENEPMQMGEQMESLYAVRGRFTVNETESLSLSEKHMQWSNHWSENKASKSSPKRSRSKQVSKKINVLKQKIENCEQQFEDKMGYRPSFADKMKDEELCTLINEQTELKKELKNIKDEVGSSLRRKVSETMKGVEEQRDQINLHLANLRLKSGRPNELSEMTSDQLADEKQDLQSLLTEFEKTNRLPLNKQDKEIMSDLYERFRQLKRLSRRTSDLVPIPEEESISLTLASPSRRMSTDLSATADTQQVDDFVIISRSKTLVFESAGSKDEEVTTEESWHTMSFSELHNQLRRLREFKKNFKRSINQFEEEFHANVGRKAQGADKLPIEETYLLYRSTKSKIKLIKALIEKHVQ